MGGIPRYVLEDVSSDPERLLTSACKECYLADDATSWVSNDSDMTPKTQVLQKLIHLDSPEPYTEPEVRYLHLPLLSG